MSLEKVRPISSAQNPKFKAALRLHASRGRKQQGRFLIHGAREVSRALQAGRYRLAEVFVCSALTDTSQLDLILPQAEATEVGVFEVPLELFSKLAYGDRSDGWVAVAFQQKRQLVDLSLPDGEPNERTIVVVLEGLEKPGNLGAVARSADGAGVHALISANPCTDIFHPNAIRASLGTLLAMPVAEADSASVLNWLIENGFSIYAAWVGAEHSYQQINYPMRTAIVLGNEAEGLSDVWRGAAVTPIGLPMRGIADSLNISAAAAVLMYEVATQSAP